MFIGQKLILSGSNPQKINVLRWPSSSADLNPIGNVWRLLTRKAYVEGMEFATKEQLKTARLKSWEEITTDQLQKI